MRSILLGRTGKKCVIAVTLICFFTTMCAVSPQVGWALSLSEEKELGRKLLEVIKERLPLVEDGEIIAYVQSVGNRIAKQVGTTPYQYQFFIVDEAVPNAFAIPGGYIFVYRGLIELMKTEGELAGILSHELAHIQARHIQRRMEEGRILNVATVAGILAAVLLGMSGGGAGAGQALALGTMAGSRTLELKYSRENEKEADQLGFRYLCAAGYSPREMVSVMEKLNQGTWRSSSRVPSYLMTHPALGERILYLGDMVQKQGEATSKPARSNTMDDFQIMQAALVAGHCDTKIAFDRFQAQLRQKDGARVSAIYGLARLALRQGKINESLSQMQDAARQASGSPFVLSSLGAMYLQLGKVDEARKVLQTALILDPASPIAHLRLAQVLAELGQKEDALQHLYQIEGLAPTFPEIDHHLGVLLGQINRVGLAHYHLGRYHEQRRDWKVASFHYRKAMSLLKDSPQKLEEVEHTLKDVEKRNRESVWEKKR